MSSLRNQLFAAMEPRQIFHAPVWGNPRPMSEALRDIRRSLGDSEGVGATQDVLQKSLHRFAATQRVDSFVELKYVCYGLTVPIGTNQWRLIDREPLFNKLLDLVEEHSGQAKQYRRCFQGLLNGYFGFDRAVDQAGPGDANWLLLRQFLAKKLRPLLKASAVRGTTPEWLSSLESHRNLLADDPCKRYAAGLQAGRTDELKTLCAELGISSTSWVWDEALMAYVRTVCEGSDRKFTTAMPAVLDLVDGRSELKVAQFLSTQATALTVARYSKCLEHPEHTGLRDASLQWIGNPWISTTAWDAHVQHEPARKMVEGWLKRRLIKDFFESLAQDGGADLRRLNYWLKWEPEITDMWFVLGGDARRNRTEAFLAVRKRMVGRERFLDDPNDQNSAFVMRIGPLVVIEFGVTGNACYAFAASDFKTDLDTKTLSVHALKQKLRATRLSHMHRWESRFDYELKKLLQSVPSSKGTMKSADKARTAAAIPAVKSVVPRSPPVAPVSVHPPVAIKAQTPSIAPPHGQAKRVIAESKYSLDETGRGVQPAWPWAIPSDPDSQMEPIASRPAVPTPAPVSAVAAAATQSKRWISGYRSLSQVEFDSIVAKCKKQKIAWKDNRSKDGALWILIPDRATHSALALLLDIHGFHYKAGKGFWFENEG